MLEEVFDDMRLLAELLFLAQGQTSVCELESGQLVQILRSC